jgi:hypothetical protein
MEYYTKRLNVKTDVCFIVHTIKWRWVWNRAVIMRNAELIRNTYLIPSNPRREGHPSPFYGEGLCTGVLSLADVNSFSEFK